MDKTIFKHTEKALVIKTGKLFDVIRKYRLTSSTIIHYTLSNGLSYYESSLIVGIDNIRDYKLKNIL